MDNQTIIEVKHLFDINDIELSICGEEGHLHIVTDDDILDSIADKVMFFAKRNRMTKEQYLEWRAIINKYHGYSGECFLQCCGLTKRGKRCQNQIKDSFRSADYLNGYHKSVYCQLHNISEIKQ
jgi:hypothetical protein